MLVVSLLFAVNAITLYCSQENIKKSRNLITAGVRQDHTIEFYSVKNPEQKLMSPYSWVEYSFGSYEQLIHVPSFFGKAGVYYHRATGDTIIAYYHRGFLHVGNIDRDTILKRVYLDGEDHDFVEIGQYYFDRVRKGLASQKLHRDNCCTVS